MNKKVKNNLLKSSIKIKNIVFIKNFEVSLLFSLIVYCLGLFMKCFVLSKYSGIVNIFYLLSFPIFIFL